MKTDWTANDVLEAAAAWIWVPKGAAQVCTDEYQLICYPDRFTDQAWPPAQVVWSRSMRGLDAVIDEVAGHVRAWGLNRVYWWVSGASAPTDTERVLRSRGGRLDERLEVLAADLDSAFPANDLPEHVTVELVQDERTVRAASFVATNGWGRAQPDEADLARQLDEVTRDLRNWSSFRVVAFVAQQPVSTAGCSLVGPVARMWGGVTHSTWRGLGFYRRVLFERMRLASDHGATIALVRGRAKTSAPILRRCGFVSYGEERRYRLDLN